jgi:hypothetical protein
MNKLLKYNEAKLKVLNRIGELKLKPGDALPSQGKLIEGESFSMISLRRALNDLEADGLIEKRQGCPMRLSTNFKQASFQYTVACIYIYDSKYSSFNVEVRPRQSDLVSFFGERGIRLETITAIAPSAEVTEKLGGMLGVILCGWITQEWVDFLRVFKLPVVVAGNNPFPEEFSSVYNDWPAAVDMLYAQLEKRGARRIAFLNSAERYYPTAGMYEAFRRRTSDFKESMVLCCDCFDGSKGIADFLEANRDVDAFLVEKGLIFAFLAISREFPGMEKKEIGVISEGRLNVDFKFEKMLITYFKETIFVEAGKLFLEKISSQDHTVTHSVISPLMLDPQESS